MEYDETITLHNIVNDSVRIIYNKFLSPTAIYENNLDFYFNCDCKVIKMQNESFDFQDTFKTNFFIINNQTTESNSYDVELFAGGNIDKNGKIVINFSIIEEPLPITFIFIGNKK
jgi:hypothetical protein